MASVGFPGLSFNNSRERKPIRSCSPLVDEIRDNPPNSPLCNLHVRTSPNWANTNTRLSWTIPGDSLRTQAGLEACDGSSGRLQLSRLELTRVHSWWDSGLTFVSRCFLYLRFRSRGRCFAFSGLSSCVSEARTSRMPRLTRERTMDLRLAALYRRSRCSA
jgi:hypothetical protein